MKSKKIPVTILTGFLGSGKTTLLNRILKEQHGRRIAIIENEYGEINIDHELVISADEEIIEMSNGCICCTVRGDLIRILSNLMNRKDKFDYVLIETTGLADPGPVAQTFFINDDIRSNFMLDGIVTVVDAKHFTHQLERSRECAEQIAFADVIVLNKTDLISQEALVQLEFRTHSMNMLAKIVKAQQANVPIDVVLGLGSFDLARTLKIHPNFLTPEYPFEWTGIYEVEPGRYSVSVSDGPDETMSLVLCENIPEGDEALAAANEFCVRMFSETPLETSPKETLTYGRHQKLIVTQSGRKEFKLVVEKKSRLGIYTQHTAQEYNLRLQRADGVILEKNDSISRNYFTPLPKRPLPILGQILRPVDERVWVEQHAHDDSVGSMAIDVVGEVSPKLFDLWMGDLLAYKGEDLYRMKGIVSVHKNDYRFIFHAVHMLFDGAPDRLWKQNEERRNQLVFIGRNLDKEAIRNGFMACIVKP